MSEFLVAVSQTAFLQWALLAGVLASIGCGIMGSYVVVRRISFLAGGIAHTALAGMGIAYFLGASPILGALASALVAALLIGWINLRVRQQEDILIAAFWSMGMALGILFISRTPGYNIDLMSYLFGNILMVSRPEVVGMGILDGVLLALVLLFHRPLMAVCFDEEFSRLRGLPVEFFHLLLLCMVSLTVVLLIQLVGLILVLALLTLPAAIAAHYLDNLFKMMLVATLVGVLSTTLGLALSFIYDFPSGATIILVVGALYFGSLLFSGLLHGRH